jgi:hypothetical protein
MVNSEVPSRPGVVHEPLNRLDQRAHPLSQAEADERHRRSDERHERLDRLMQKESALLSHGVQELLRTRTTTIREPTGIWTASLHRAMGRDGQLTHQGSRNDGRTTRGRLHIAGNAGGKRLEHELTLQLAQGLAWLRQP